MACSPNNVFSVSGLNKNMLILKSKPKGLSRSCFSVDFTKSTTLNSRTSGNFSVSAQASTCISRALRWWEKTLKPNMTEIHSAQQLVHTLLNAGDALVVIDFYSPGCGGCKALHPKICQLAESHPEAMFLQLNYEEMKTMCHGLRIHVLPFFRFYRGAEGRICSLSCTNATIKKFKDALAKHGTERCSLGPAKGLEESEMEILASRGLISISSPLGHPNVEDLVLKSNDISDVLNHAKANNIRVLNQEANMLREGHFSSLKRMRMKTDCGSSEFIFPHFFPF